MPSLSLLGALLDTAGSAIKAVRNKASTPDSSTANDASTAAAALPFARTLQQSVASQTPAAPASASSGSTSTVASAASALANGMKPSNGPDDPTHDDTAAANPDAAALAAAAAVQAQLLARPDAAPTASAPSDGDPPATAQQTLAGQAATAITAAANATKDAVQPAAGAADPGTSRDALHAALEKFTGGANAAAMPATGATAPQAAATTAAAPLTPKALTFDKTLADAKGALAATQAQAPAAQSLLADAAAKIDTPHALAATQDATDAARATLAAATAVAQPSVQTSQAAGAAASAHALAPHVGTADWTEALSQKVVFLSNAHQQSAELTLNPPDLGPLQVVLRVADNHAHALFVSQHAQVREAVEAALPKLRDAMEAGGLGLGSATVSDGGFASSQQNPQQTFAGGQSSRRGNGAPSADGAAADAARPAATVATQSRAGLVDTFA